MGIKREQVIYAKKELRKMHPLMNLDLELCLPFLDPCVGVGRRCLVRNGCMQPPRGENTEDRQGLAGADALQEAGSGLNRVDLELAEGEAGPDEPLFDFFLEEGEDAMTRLGYGVVSYFNVIWTFLVIFTMITAINVPVMYANSQWAGFANIRQLSGYAQYTLGNLGASEARCLNVRLLSESLSVSCNTGQIGKITQWGVYAKDTEADQRSLCSADGVSVSTGLSCASVSAKDHALYTDKLQPCEGQSSCLVHGIQDALPLGSQWGDSGCTLSETDSLFVQYTCVIPDDELKIKRHQALVSSCVNVFAALTLLSVIANRQGSIAIEKKEWDLQTVTASDYCLELSLSKDQVAGLRQEL